MKDVKKQPQKPVSFENVIRKSNILRKKNYEVSK